MGSGGFIAAPRGGLRDFSPNSAGFARLYGKPSAIVCVPAILAVAASALSPELGGVVGPLTVLLALLRAERALDNSAGIREPRGSAGAGLAEGSFAGDLFRVAMSGSLRV